MNCLDFCLESCLQQLAPITDSKPSSPSFHCSQTPLPQGPLSKLSLVLATLPSAPANEGLGQFSYLTPLVLTHPGPSPSGPAALYSPGKVQGPHSPKCCNWQGTGPALLTTTGGEGWGREGITPFPVPTPPHSRQVAGPSLLGPLLWGLLTCIPSTRHSSIVLSRHA